MVTVCAWCQKYMGSMEPLQETRISHGVCGDCAERDSLDDAPVLVVSPGRARANLDRRERTARRRMRVSSDLC